MYIFLFIVTRSPQSFILERKYALFIPVLYLSLPFCFLLPVLVLDLFIRIRRQNDRGWQKARYLRGSANRSYLRPLVVSSALPSCSSVHFAAYTVPALSCLSRTLVRFVLRHKRRLHGVRTRRVHRTALSHSDNGSSPPTTTTTTTTRTILLVDVTSLFRQT